MDTIETPHDANSTKTPSKRRLRHTKRKRTFLNSIPGMNKVENWLSTFDAPAVCGSTINRLFDTTTRETPLRSLPLPAARNSDDDDSSVDTTKYIKSNRTITRLQRRAVSIRKYSRLCPSPTPRSTDSCTQSRPTAAGSNAPRPCTKAPGVKRKRMVKYKSSTNLKVRQHRCESSSSSSSGHDDDASDRRTSRRALLPKKRVRHDSV